jgi:hypothetical protein
MNLYRFGYVVSAMAFALVACNGNSLHVTNPANANASTTLNQNKRNDETRNLDLEKPEIEQAIQPSDPVNAKFVQVEVTEVTNPQNRPARFEVFYQPKEGEKILLGSFSLYPPNNPGKFIVPTQGKVKAEGKLVLSLAKPDGVATGDQVSVSVKKLRFVSDVDH